MRFINCVFALLFLNSTLLFADVTEVTKIKVDIAKLGSYASETTSRYTSRIKADDADSKFESSGLMGKLAGSFFANGRLGSIVNLDEKNVYSIVYKEKKYSVQPIQKISMPELEGNTDESDDDEGEAAPSQVKVLRQEFKVIDTGNEQMLNAFKVHEYHIHYLYEVENINTRVIRTDSMKVIVMTTAQENLFEQANRTKAAFQKEYMAAMGLDYQDMDYESMMGMNWLKIMQSLDPKSQVDGNQAPTLNFDELKKIKGYPVLTDGQMCNRVIDPNQTQAQSSSGDEGIPTSFGGLFNKAKKKMDDSKEKKDPSAYQGSLSWRMETVSVLLDGISADKLAVPAGFKKTK